MRRFARSHGATVQGARAVVVDVQASVAGDDETGETAFRIVGLPDSALREGRERIRGAVIHGGWRWPNRSVTVSLGPASARKEGASLDLPIALAVMQAQGTLPSDPPAGPLLARSLVLGELTLDGAVRPARGVIAAVEAAREAGFRDALVPRENAPEAAAVSGVEAFPVDTLRDAVAHLSGAATIAPEPGLAWRPEPWDGRLAAEVRGQPTAVRCAVLAAVGGHNLLLSGPPGAGKTLLARALAHLMPPFTYEEALEASRLHSIAGRLQGGLLRRRPFRAPHHTTSLPGLLGGGSVLRPGEISLAHLGILFLDELPEFPRTTLEALRQPLENGRVVVARASGHETFPADVLLVAAMNPCPCGWRGVGDRCRCPAHAVERYARRVSGPLQDRFDLHVTVRPVPPDALLRDPAGEVVPEEAVREARERQVERSRRLRLSRVSNARIPARALPRAVDPAPGALAFLAEQSARLGLTGRGMHKALRVARTVADLDGSGEVTLDHVAEAVGYRGPGPDAT